MRKSQSVRYSDPSLPDAPSLYKSSAIRQKNMKNLFKGGAIKETMGRLINKFFIYESVPPSKANSHHFKNMIVGVQQVGMGIEPPSPYEIKHKYLDMEYKDMEAYVNIQREKWKTYGCTIMSDGWTGPTKLSIINFMDVIKEVGKQNVVQIVTDNGSAFVKAGKLLMKKYNLYWTPCATLHRLNVRRHRWLLAQMRKVCGGDIVRPGATRFATNYIALDKVVPTMPFVYELIRVMKENLIRLNAKEWVLEIIADRWDRTLKHPLHAAAFFLNPRFQYKRGVGTDPDLLQAVHEVFAKLDPTSEGLSQFGNEIILFRDAKRGFGDRAAIASRSEMVPEHDKVAEKDYLDLLDIATEVGEEEDNQLFQWVRPLHLDDEDGNPDPRIAAHVREAGISQPAVTSRPSFDSTSVEHSSRPSATGTSASGYDGSRGEGTNDGSDPGNDEGDVRQQQQSGQPLAFTCEDDFTHCTQDEDHGSRRAGPGVGAIGKPYRGRQRRMMPYNEDSLSASFESMSVETQFSDSSNEANIYAPYAMSYGQPPQNLSSSTDEEYERYNYPSSTQMPYYLPHQLQQQGFQTSTWENPGFPIHGQLLVGLKKFMHGILLVGTEGCQLPTIGRKKLAGYWDHVKAPSLDYMTIGGGLGWHLRPCVWMLWTEILGLQPYANSSTVLFHKRNSTCKGTKCSCKLVSFTRSHSLNSRWNLQCSAPLYPYFKDI
ncbi:hypothetical protein CK203_114806 [Vitis vinifera]|uniref:DUF659 domain-containing protein n=1 Tax=Vitis vinifera TaxID=29760 RepID=A0A438CDG7_VITVI|nr:hypothetical protein CK203_114806 [Vitis vinifera]